jgi:DNA-binding transcriptional LysR family regulator
MDRDMELRHLRYFVAVAEELHFGRAADRLHLSQPPLSQQIRKLENILGYPLFARTSRAVRLTSAGVVFLERARSTLRKVHEDLDEARSIGRGEIGFLRVGFIPSAMLTNLPAMLGRYRLQFPGVHLQLHESHTSSVIHSILDTTLDAGFLRDGGPTPGVEVKIIHSESFVAVVATNHPLAAHTTISAAKLRDQPFVFFSPTAGAHAYEKGIAPCVEQGFRPRVVQEAPQWLTVLRLVGAGLGVTVAPACVRQIATENVVCINLRNTKARSNMELAYRTGEDRAIVAAFATIARESFRATRQEIMNPPVRSF